MNLSRGEKRDEDVVFGDQQLNFCAASDDPFSSARPQTVDDVEV